MTELQYQVKKESQDEVSKDQEEDGNQPVDLPEVELLAIDAELSSWRHSLGDDVIEAPQSKVLTKEDKLAMPYREKEEGNNYARLQQYEQAIKHYEKSLNAMRSLFDGFGEGQDDALIRDMETA